MKAKTTQSVSKKKLTEKGTASTLRGFMRELRADWKKRDVALDKKFTERDVTLDKKFTERDAIWSKNLDKKYAERDAVLDKKFAERDANWEKKLQAQNEETRRYMGILSEEFGHKVQLVAEQVMLVSERVDRMNERLERVEAVLQTHTEMIGKLMGDVQDIKHELTKKVDREQVDKLEKRVLALELHVGMGPGRRAHA